MIFTKNTEYVSKDTVWLEECNFCNTQTINKHSIINTLFSSRQRIPLHSISAVSIFVVACKEPCWQEKKSPLNRMKRFFIDIFHYSRHTMHKSETGKGCFQNAYAVIHHRVNQNVEDDVFSLLRFCEHFSAIFQIRREFLEKGPDSQR